MMVCGLLPAEGSAVAALEAKLLLQQALQEFQSEEHRLYEARTTVERRWRWLCWQRFSFPWW